MQTQKDGSKSNLFFLIIFFLIAIGAIVLTQNGSNNKSDAPASP